MYWIGILPTCKLSSTPSASVAISPIPPKKRTCQWKIREAEEVRSMMCRAYTPVTMARWLHGYLWAPCAQVNLNKTSSKFQFVNSYRARKNCSIVYTPVPRVSLLQNTNHAVSPTYYKVIANERIIAWPMKVQKNQAKQKGIHWAKFVITV